MRRTLLALAAMFAVAIPAFAQDTAPPVDPSLPRVAIETGAGRFVVAVETKKAPVTAANFLKYVDQKRLDGTRFYRVAKGGVRFGFVQFGVDGDPKRMLPPIRHEPTTQTGLRHFDGTLSVARSAPGTARGEFTISVGDQFGLDADPTAPGDNLGYATFGRVVDGMDVVRKIFDAPISPTKTVRGSFKGEVPEAAVTVLTARRVATGMDVVEKIFDAPISPTKTVRGSFKGEVPEAAVTVLTARRVATMP